MRNLINTIEQIEPGHFERRREILERLRKEVYDAGYDPLPISDNDVNCYWVRVSCGERMCVKITVESWEDGYYRHVLTEYAKKRD